MAASCMDEQGEADIEGTMASVAYEWATDERAFGVKVCLVDPSRDDIRRCG